MEGPELATSHSGSLDALAKLGLPTHRLHRVCQSFEEVWEAIAGAHAALVASGRTYVDPVLAGVLSSSAATERMTNLTQRERDVLRLLADGMSNEEIGKNLFISPETVRTHVRKAMAKLDADTRTQAVATALRQSLIA